MGDIDTTTLVLIFSFIASIITMLSNLLLHVRIKSGCCEIIPIPKDEPIEDSKEKSSTL